MGPNRFINNYRVAVVGRDARPNDVFTLMSSTLMRFTFLDRSLGLLLLAGHHARDLVVGDRGRLAVRFL